MVEEKKKLLEKINNQIMVKKEKLLNNLPVVHQIEDGLIIRFFSNWESCDDNRRIKYKKIESDVEGEKLYNFFLPKGTILDIKKREYAGCILCLTGHIELFVKDDVVDLKAHQKKCLEDDTYHGKVYKDSYIVTQTR